MITNGLSLRDPAFVGSLSGGGGCPPAPTVGSWKEIGRTTLACAGDSISVTSLAGKEQYMVLYHATVCGSCVCSQFRLNCCSSGGHYSLAYACCGAAKSDLTSLNYFTVGSYGATTAVCHDEFQVHQINNTASGMAKQGIMHGVMRCTTAASTAPKRIEMSSKWDNTTDSINAMKVDHVTSPGSGSFAAGSELVVLGFSASDTHPVACNFWQELGSTCASGSSCAIDVSFSTRKYLMIEAYTNASSAHNNRIQFGTSCTIDTCNNYARRRSACGGTESAGTCIAYWSIDAYNGTDPIYHQFYMINDACNTKMGIGHSTRLTSGGAACPPQRVEWVSKWTEACAGADIVRFTTGCANYSSDSFVKVWGSN